MRNRLDVDRGDYFYVPVSGGGDGPVVLMWVGWVALAGPRAGTIRICTKRIARYGGWQSLHSVTDYEGVNRS